MKKEHYIMLEELYEKINDFSKLNDKTEIQKGTCSVIAIQGNGQFKLNCCMNLTLMQRVTFLKNIRSFCDDIDKELQEDLVSSFKESLEKLKEDE